MNNGIAMSKRQEIIRSAAIIVHREGAAKLTLAAVAKEAGISKGGLLYHFPNKDSLIQAMVTELMDQFAENLERRVERDPNPQGRWCRAYAQEVFTHFGELMESNAGLLAAVSNDQEKLQPVRERYSMWMKRMEQDGTDRIASIIIRLAADGLKFNALFGIPTVQGEERMQVMEALLLATGQMEDEKN